MDTADVVTVVLGYDWMSALADAAFAHEMKASLLLPAQSQR